MLGAPEWHPIAVHFPLALVLTGAAALSASRIDALGRYSAALATVGTWNVCLGAVGALFALGTGLAAVVSLHVDAAARAAVALHVKWAIFASMALLLVAVWRGAGSAPDARPSPWFLALLWVVAAALIVTGFHGGQNVYRYGVGVQAGARAPSARRADSAHGAEEHAK
ncbi:MAG TPA: DUF2231 domain-containing protein [Steroidobacteraceae bacterium]|jgi:uncharacterized membrane protein|nr:DUF2231 domain-containing protein [Steroidobacteraceae bacterium]